MSLVNEQAMRHSPLEVVAQTNWLFIAVSEELEHCRVCEQENGVRNELVKWVIH